MDKDTARIEEDAREAQRDQEIEKFIMLATGMGARGDSFIDREFGLE